MALCDKWFQDTSIHIQERCVAAVTEANMRNNEFRNSFIIRDVENCYVGVGRLQLPMFLL